MWNSITSLFGSFHDYYNANKHICPGIMSEEFKDWFCEDNSILLPPTGQTKASSYLPPPKEVKVHMEMERKKEAEIWKHPFPIFFGSALLKLLIFYFLLFIYLFIFCSPCGMLKSGQGLNLHHSSENTRPLTCWATRELTNSSLREIDNERDHRLGTEHDPLGKRRWVRFTSFSLSGIYNKCTKQC